MQKTLITLSLLLFSSLAQAGTHCYAIPYKSLEGNTITKFRAKVDIDWCTNKARNDNNRYEVYFKFYSDSDNTTKILRYNGGGHQSTGKNVELWDTNLIPLHTSYSARSEPKAILKTYLLYKMNGTRKKYRWISTIRGLIKG